MYRSRLLIRYIEYRAFYLKRPMVSTRPMIKDPVASIICRRKPMYNIDYSAWNIEKAVFARYNTACFTLYMEYGDGGRKNLSCSSEQDLLRIVAKMSSAHEHTLNAPGRPSSRFSPSVQVFLRLPIWPAPVLELYS